MTVPLTLLALSGIGVTPYSARGLHQTYAPIQQALQTKRTVNGVLKDVSSTQFQKYASTISGADQQPPACDGVWPGRLITVDCLFYLSYKTAGGSPSRTEVPGSSYVEGDFTFYRPRLTMLVTAFSSDEDEWNAEITWSMQLEEV
jgi:hypothetical protein